MNWEMKILGDIGEWGSGGTPLSSQSEYYNGTIPWLIIEDLNDGVVKTSQKTITELGLKNSSAKIVEPGTLLIAMYGSIGKLGIAGITCATNQAIAFCRCNPELVDLNFLFYYLLFSREKLLDMGKGNTQQNIGQAVLKEYPIPLPPLPEQRRIADLLARADRLRRMRRAGDTLSASLLQSVFLEMFGDPASNPKGWDVFYLAELCESSNGIKAGPFGSSLKKEIYTKSGYRIYGQEQVIGGSFAIGDYYISKEIFEKDFKAYEVKPNDVLISLVGTFGKTIIVPEGIKPGIINPRLLKISPRKDKLNSVYLAQYLQLSSVQKQFLDLSHGGTMGILNAGQLKEFKIICPPLPQQEQFAAVVRRVESLRARAGESARQGEGLFQSLLHEAFRG
jgi:type I restriction enzyme S subunit